MKNLTGCQLVGSALIVILNAHITPEKSAQFLEPSFRFRFPSYGTSDDTVRLFISLYLLFEIPLFETTPVRMAPCWLALTVIERFLPIITETLLLAMSVSVNIIHAVRQTMVSLLSNLKAAQIVDAWLSVALSAKRRLLYFVLRSVVQHKVGFEQESLKRFVTVQSFNLFQSWRLGVSPQSDKTKAV